MPFWIVRLLMFPHVQIERRFRAGEGQLRDDDRITIPSPEYDHSCRDERERCGVITTGTDNARRIGPNPGQVSKILLIG